jgi:hypothetical protein
MGPRHANEVLPLGARQSLALPTETFSVLLSSTDSRPATTLRRMRHRVLSHASSLIVLIGLCFTSCRNAPPTSKAYNLPATVSPAQERYKKTVEDQLGRIWYRLTELHEDSLRLGTVDTTFEIPATGGKVRSLTVTSNTGGRMDELIARIAIEQLRAPPVPHALLAQLHQDYIVLEESFTVLDDADRPSPTPLKKR